MGPSNRSYLSNIAISTSMIVRSKVNQAIIKQIPAWFRPSSYVRVLHVFSVSLQMFKWSPNQQKYLFLPVFCLQVTQKKLDPHRPQIAKNNFCVVNVKKKCLPPTIAHYNGTLQWHPAMAPRPLPQSWSSPSPPNHSTLQWHPAMAPSNGTTSTPPKFPLPKNWSSPYPPTIAHCNGTLRWHPAMAPRPLHPAMAPWCHVQSAKVVRRPPPLLEVRTPIAIAIWGKTNPCNKGRQVTGWSQRLVQVEATSAVQPLNIGSVQMLG